MSKKHIKYLFILITVGLIFFVKNKIDTRNKNQQIMLDSIDDGIAKPTKQ